MIPDAILNKLFSHTEEEKEILQGRASVNQDIYTDESEFVIDINKFLLPNQLITVRKHTRFVDFPLHTHNYVEILYVYRGSFTHVIGGREMTIYEGELMVLNQAISHSIKKSGEEDIILNFIIRPEFFQYLFSLAKMDNPIFNFILKSMFGKSMKGEYLHFKDEKQEFLRDEMEKIIVEIYQGDMSSNITIQLLVGLILVKLVKNIENIEFYSVDSYEAKLNVDILKYIFSNYKEGSLAEVSQKVNQPNYKVCRIIKKYTGYTFKELIQQTRLKQATELLRMTDLPVTEIMLEVGYENITYFYKIFKECYQMTPYEYRKQLQE